MVNNIWLYKYNGSKKRDRIASDRLEHALCASLWPTVDQSWRGEPDASDGKGHLATWRTCGLQPAVNVGKFQKGDVEADPRSWQPG